MGSAAYAWQQLKTNEAFLNATLKTATEIVDDAVTQAERFGVPRTATLSLLTKAEGLFDNMAMLGKPTPELRYQKAWMLIQFARNYQAVGDTKKWRERALSAQEMLAALCRRGAGQAGLCQRARHCQQHARRRARCARRSIGRSAKLWRLLDACLRLANADPDNGALLRDVAVAVERVGDVQYAQGKLPDALKSFQQSQGLAEILARADPKDPTWQRDLSVSHNKIGDVLMAEGDLSGALSAYREGLCHRRTPG